MGATLRSQSESPSRDGDGDDEDGDDYDDNDDNINIMMKCLSVLYVTKKSSFSQSFLSVCYVLFSLSRMLSLSVCLSHFILTYSSGASSGLSV